MSETNAEPEVERSAEVSTPSAAEAPAERPEGGTPSTGEAPASRPDRGGERPRRRSGGGGGGGGRFGRRRVCSFCVDKVQGIDYKDPAKLRRYVSDRAKIEPRRKTGTCARHQRMLTTALKRARHLALLPFTAQHIHVSGAFPVRPDRPDRSDRYDRSDRPDRRQD